jgi:hypothetical protein
MTSIAAQNFALDLLALARLAPESARFGTRRVFLSELCDLQSAEDCALLLECMHAGLLRLARADYVGGMDPAMVAASEWRIPSGAATYHFLCVA